MPLFVTNNLQGICSKTCSDHAHFVQRSPLRAVHFSGCTALPCCFWRPRWPRGAASAFLKTCNRLQWTSRVAFPIHQLIELLPCKRPRPPAMWRAATRPKIAA